MITKYKFKAGTVQERSIKEILEDSGNQMQFIHFYRGNESTRDRSLLARLVVDVGDNQTGVVGVPPCIQIGYSSGLVPRAEKGAPAIY